MILMLESRLLRAAHSRNRCRYSHFEQSLYMLIPSCRQMTI